MCLQTPQLTTLTAHPGGNATGGGSRTRNIAKDDRCDLQWCSREDGPGRLALPGPCAFQSQRAVPSTGCPGDPRAASNAKECFCGHVLELPSYKLPNAMCTQAGTQNTDRERQLETKTLKS